MHPVAALIGGLLGATIGVRATLLASMPVRLPVLMVLMLASPRLRRGELPAVIAAPEAEPADADQTR